MSFRLGACLLLKAVMSLSLVVILAPLDAWATSGACSYHGGVDCERGMQPDGKVYCNDGWTESATYYEFTQKCQGGASAQSASDIIYEQYRYDGKIVDGPISYNYNGRIVIDDCPLNSTRDFDYANESYYCICDDGYYNYSSNNLALPNQTCEKRAEPFVPLYASMKKASDKVNDELNNIERTNARCRNLYGNSYADSKGDCQCETGYRWRYAAYENFVFCDKREDYDEVIRNAAVINPGKVPDKPTKQTVPAVPNLPTADPPAVTKDKGPEMDTETQAAPQATTQTPSTSDASLMVPPETTSASTAENGISQPSASQGQKASGYNILIIILLIFVSSAIFYLAGYHLAGNPSEKKKLGNGTSRQK